TKFILKAEEFSIQIKDGIRFYSHFLICAKLRLYFYIWSKGQNNLHGSQESIENLRYGSSGAGDSVCSDGLPERTAAGRMETRYIDICTGRDAGADGSYDSTADHYTFRIGSRRSLFH